MKKTLFLILTVITIVGLYAKNANEVQPIDASQRNQITGSGGGGSGDVTAAGNNSFTGNNTFSGENTFSGNNTFSLTNSFAKPVFIGTNGTFSGHAQISGEMLHIVPLGGVGGNVGVIVDTLGLGATAAVGVASGSGNYGILRLNSSGNTELIVGSGGAAFDLIMGGGTTNMLALTSTTFDLGHNASTAFTFKGATASIPNGFNIGSGQWVMPVSGVITNSGSGLFTAGTLRANGHTTLTNGTVQGTWTVNGTSSAINSSNATLTVTVSNSLGQLIFGGGQRVDRVQTTTNFIVEAGNHFIGVRPAAANLTVTLPAASTAGAGATYIIKDENLSAASTNIFVVRAGSDLIDGAITNTISSNGGAVRIYTDGSASWFTW